MGMYSYEPRRLLLKFLLMEAGRQKANCIKRWACFNTFPKKLFNLGMSPKYALTQLPFSCVIIREPEKGFFLGKRKPQIIIDFLISNGYQNNMLWYASSNPMTSI